MRAVTPYLSRRGELESHGTSGRVLIVSHRLPMTWRVFDASLRVYWRRTGGMARLYGMHERSNGLWIGWPGQMPNLGLRDVNEFRRQLKALRAVPVPIDADDMRDFNDSTARAILWPLCHDQLGRLPLQMSGWDLYERLNGRFADVVAGAWRPGDVLWVHDYQLMRLPLLLRRRLPTAAIGCLFHVPFPSPESLRVLSVRDWLLEGMLGADLIGFHSSRDRLNFAASVGRILQVEVGQDHHVRVDGRVVRLGVFPMGVDSEDIARRASDRGVTRIVIAHRHRPERLMLGIDRLDYTEGLLRRLAAFERLLLRYPEWREHVRLVQIAVPPRRATGAHRRFRRRLELLVARINGRFGTPRWTPIQNLHRRIRQSELLALYRAADAMLVMPTRNGLNLVAKEFVATRTDEDGILILSEFATAAEELTEALLVNPYDVDDVAATINRALLMEGPERRRRMRNLRARVRANDVRAWASRFLGTLAAARPA